MWLLSSGGRHHKYSAMQTFKQFLSENDLERLHLELFLQRQFGLSKEERVEVADWIDGEIGDFDERPVWQKIYDYYVDQMPYDVAKGEAPDWETESWVNEMVLHDLKDGGVETHFKPDGKNRPRDSSDPMPRRRHDDYSSY